MKKLLVLSLVAAACGGSKPPVIDSFVADKTSLSAGDAVVLTWSVQNATSLTITPEPGAVTGTTVTVHPQQTGDYQLKAQNKDGAVAQTITFTVAPAQHPAVINFFTSDKAQVGPGQPVTLKWSVSNAAKIELIAGTGAAEDVTSLTQKVVNPSSTVTYQLKATSPAGLTSPTPAAQTIRVSAAPSDLALAASSTAISQGQSVTLTFSGSATTWSIGDGATTRNLGPMRCTSAAPCTTVVRPGAGSVTYTLTGTAITGVSATKTVTITVTANAGTSLVYTAPTSTTEALKLIAETCANPCTSMIFHVRFNSVTQLRGAALNLPLDVTKVGVGSSFVTGLTNAAGKVALGTGPLNEVLVLGVSKKGAAGAPAADENSSDVAMFTVTLKPEGGKGIVFGPGVTADPRFVVDVRSTSPNAGGIAIGTLTVN